MTEREFFFFQAEDGIRDMKHDILEKLAETMYSFKAYPKDDDFSSVAKALISKHPCLTEPGPHRWYGWKNSLKLSHKASKSWM